MNKILKQPLNLSAPSQNFKLKKYIPSLNCISNKFKFKVNQMALQSDDFKVTFPQWNSTMTPGVFYMLAIEDTSINTATKLHVRF